MKITIDLRERDLIALFDRDEILTTTLNLGDILITGNSAIILERKRIDDFYASMRDGRFADQKMRLKQTSGAHLIYVIEGDDIDAGRGQFPASVLDHTCWTMLLCSKLRVVRTSNINETASLIRYLSGKVDEEVKTSDEYVVSVSKKNLMSSRAISIAMLRNIPGISLVVATAIIDEYKTIQGVIETLQKNKENIENLNINYQKSSRKIGIRLTQKLKSHLLNEIDDSTN